MQLNRRALALVDQLLQDCDRYRIAAQPLSGELAERVTLIDLGIDVPGGLAAGELLAQICLADLAEVKLVQQVQNGATGTSITGPAVIVQSDWPVMACLASQYAGWKLTHDKFFALGSGPMRAAASKEELFTKLAYHDAAEQVVGVLETRQLPPAEICAQILAATGASHLTLLIAPTASLAGNLQIVARSVETALHKLSELNFDLTRIVSAWGIAPLPPVAKHDMAGIGRTNDAILYGAEVTLWVRGDDDTLTTIGPHVPSNSSADHGQPFGEIFKRYNYNFYEIDPHLFSPARITFQNVTTGRSHSFGAVAPEILASSFGW